MSAGLRRGALIVFEGCDRSGKTTQCRKLVDKLNEIGITTQMMQFPDRTTATGTIINDYLAKKGELSDQAIHLLFSANRWENQPKMKQLLQKGVTLVVDRYSYSGVAYSAAKPGLDFNWCRNPEIGLPKPDLVLFLQLPMDVIAGRSGYGEERYESVEFLRNVTQNYLRLKQDNWILVDAHKDVEELHTELLNHAREMIERVQHTKLEELS